MPWPAVLLWEICSGERPLRGRLRPLRVPQECPKAVADLALRCMSRDPALRPTAAQLLQELGQLMRQRAFAADRTTTTLLGRTTSGGGEAGARPAGALAQSPPQAQAQLKRMDSTPLRTLRLSTEVQRSASLNHYPLLAAAATGFGGAGPGAGAG